MTQKLAPIDNLVVSNFNIRKHLKGIDELAASISKVGLLEPLLVRQKGNKLEVVAGQRRLLACKKVGLSEVPVIVKEMSDEDAIFVSLSENVHREDVSDLEKAEAVFWLRNKGYTFEEIAEKLSVSRMSLARWTALGEASPTLKRLVREQKISESDAEEIAIAIKDKTLQSKVAKASVGGTRETMRRLLKYAENYEEVLKHGPITGELISSLTKTKKLIFEMPAYLYDALAKASKEKSTSMKDTVVSVLEPKLKEMGYL